MWFQLVRSWRRARFGALRALRKHEWHRALADDPAEAAKWLETAARHGVVEAQALLGQMLLDGRGVAKDPVAAFERFRIAAYTGYLPAMNMVGRCLEGGWGVERDLPAAARWYRRGAEASFDWAQYNLANMLLRGRGVERDRQQAFAWFLRAARQGHAKSMNLVARFHEEGWDMPVDRLAAVEWYRRSAVLGDFRGQFNLATLLMRRNQIAEAAIWLTKAAETGSPDFLRIMAAWLQHATHPSLADIRGRVADRLVDPAIVGGGSRTE